MVLLCDNDIILKLAAFGLLDATIRVLASEEIFVLETARHRLRKPGRHTRQNFSSEIIGAAQEWTEAATPLSEAVNADVADALLNAEYEDEEGAICRIDGGEVVLFSHAFLHPESRLLTGDKKSLFALGRHRHFHPYAATIHEMLGQRVLCLEAALCLHMNDLGFEEVCSRVAPQRNCDSTMRVVFGAGEDTEESNALASLDSYLSHLEKSVGKDWLWRPEKG